MARIAAADPETLSPELRELYESASPHDQMMLVPYSQAPVLMRALHTLADTMTEHGTLSGRLVELVRLRIAFHNQCRSCMAMRYQTGLEDGLTETLVCSLERPEESPDLTPAEKAALAYADISATDHFSIDDQTFDSLRKYFTEAEIVELGLYVGYFIGFGRMVSGWNMVDELPGGSGEANGQATPWSIGTFVVQNAVMVK